MFGEKEIQRELVSIYPELKLGSRRGFKSQVRIEMAKRHGEREERVECMIAGMREKEVGNGW